MFWGLTHFLGWPRLRSAGLGPENTQRSTWVLEYLLQSNQQQKHLPDQNLYCLLCALQNIHNTEISVKNLRTGKVVFCITLHKSCRQQRVMWYREIRAMFVLFSKWNGITLFLQSDRVQFNILTCQVVQLVFFLVWFCFESG